MKNPGRVTGLRGVNMDDFNWKNCIYLKTQVVDDSDLTGGTEEPSEVEVLHLCADPQYKSGLNLDCDREKCMNEFKRTKRR